MEQTLTEKVRQLYNDTIKTFGISKKSPARRDEWALLLKLYRENKKLKDKLHALEK